MNIIAKLALVALFSAVIIQPAPQDAVAAAAPTSILIGSFSGSVGSLSGL